MSDQYGFPRFAGKHEGESLLTARRVIEEIGWGELSVPSSIILGYSRVRVPQLLAEREFEETFGYPEPWFSIWLKDGLDVGVVTGFGIGAPVAAMVLEELVEMGATRIVSLGFAGALSNDLDFGDVVICSKALRDEGVSHHYLAPSRYVNPSSVLSAKLRDSAAQRGVKVTEGPSWTIDAIFRETYNEAVAFRDEGILTVEMEAAAVFAVGQTVGVEVASLFTISDHLLAHEAWRPGLASASVGLERIVDIAIGALHA